MTLAVAMSIVLLLCAGCYGLGVLFSSRGEPTRDRFETWRGEQRGRFASDRRPIEAVVADLHRRGSRFHALHPGASYAKVEAVRSAYDRSLAECCTALGLTHLLTVLPVGPELDAERERVEALLHDCGVQLPFAA